MGGSMGGGMGGSMGGGMSGGMGGGMGGGLGSGMGGGLGGMGGGLGGGGFQQPQQTGFQQPQQTGFQPQLQPMQTGFQGGAMQPQQTGFQGMGMQRNAPPPPPVPSLPPQFQNQSGGQGGGRPSGNLSFLNAPPPVPSRMMAASPGLVSHMTGMGGGMQPLVPQVTGYVDPRLSMMTQTFMPLTNPGSSFGGGGAGGMGMGMGGGMQNLQVQQPSQALMQNIQQHNQAALGQSAQSMSWALTKAEKKQYNNIFRSWDVGNTGFITGNVALDVFGASGLGKDDLARIW